MELGEDMTEGGEEGPVDSCWNDMFTLVMVWTWGTREKGNLGDFLNILCRH